MADQTIKQQLMAHMKEAMKAKDKERLNVIRLMQAALKQIEVDERIDLNEDDARALAVLDGMLKQRRDSIEQYTKADREDLASKERDEMVIIQTFMPEPLTDDEIQQLIDDALTDAGATSMKDMGKVMGILRPKLIGRTDMGQVSVKIKERLGALT